VSEDGETESRGHPNIEVALRPRRTQHRLGWMRGGVHGTVPLSTAAGSLASRAQNNVGSGLIQRFRSLTQKCRKRGAILEQRRRPTAKFHQGEDLRGAVGLYFGICTAPQSHRIITAPFCDPGAAQEIAERSKISRTAGPAVGRVFGKRVHETPMGLSQGVIGE